eukprot:1195401-Prorocentrum_minimum.AAC.2
MFAEQQPQPPQMEATAGPPTGNPMGPTGGTTHLTLRVGCDNPACRVMNDVEIPAPFLLGGQPILVRCGNCERVRARRWVLTLGIYTASPPVHPVHRRR